MGVPNKSKELLSMRLSVLGALFLAVYGSCHAQSLKDEYDNFKKQAHIDFSSFRAERNQIYADFLRNSWAWYKGSSPMPLPKEESPVPPRLYQSEDEIHSIDTSPVEIEPIASVPQPKPICPIDEITVLDEEYFSFNFYGQKINIRLPKFANLRLNDCEPISIASGWESLNNEGMNNTIRDCLETRIRYNLCDWAYLMFLDQLAQKYCDDPNGATLLTAFLYCQSGYQMRLAVDGAKLLLLYGSKQQIFNKGYFNVDGICFYPLGEPSTSISICGATFDGEIPMSLVIEKEQLLGNKLSEEKVISADRYRDMSMISQVPQSLIDFYNNYPTSTIDGNPMTRWAMYANTPLAHKTKDKLYPSLCKCISKDDKLLAAEMLLNWVQTGFMYEYDDKVWGHDRAFFAEETLYYPYCDCEDRSILFSRLIRDLLDLDVALIYYPGHLATAVCFDQEVAGDAMIIGGRKFVVCDPTYIGAPVGAQMPDLEYNKAQAIVLKK